MNKNELKIKIINAKNGDENSFNFIIYNIKEDLFRIAKSRLLNDDDAIDAVQETIISIYYNLNKLRKISKFKIWAMKILINNCNTIYLKAKKRNELSYENIIISNIDNMEYNIEKNEEIKNAFEYLNTDERTIMTLFYINQYTSKEIAKLLNLNINTVKTKLFRAKEKLKKYIKVDGEENNLKEIDIKIKPK